LPVKQVWLLAQAIPQPPQLAELLLVSTQEPLQSVKPVAHPAAHVPALHTWAPHELPQLPQFATSELRLTHLPLQGSKPTSHTQAPALQICDAAQAVAQSLQCIESLFVSTQLVPHLVRPIEQVAAHRPKSHTWPAWHAVPQPPQLAASLFVSAHVVPQRICPIGQVTRPPSEAIALSPTERSGAASLFPPP
jgi:hypothetical protein